MIDAQHKSEERYVKLSIAFDTKEEETQVNEIVEDVIKNYEMEPNIYNSTVLHDRKVLVLEYHDDYRCETGEIFDTILHRLSIKNS
jgi:hypothetical protein